MVEWLIKFIFGVKLGKVLKWKSDVVDKSKYEKNRKKRF